MTTEEKLKKYEDWVFKNSAYNMALSIINYDKMTIAPIGGNEYRDERTAFLAGELFSTYVDKDIFNILEELKSDMSLDEEKRHEIELNYKDLTEQQRIPKEFYVEYQNLLNKAHNYWSIAREKDDYSIYEPYLKEIIEKTKQLKKYTNPDKGVYESLLDEFEPGMTEAKYDEFFSIIKKELLPFIKEVGSKTQLRDDFIYKDFPIKGQKKFMEHLVKYLHFDPSWGHLSESEHPFTDFICKNDCRTTTQYLLDNVVSGILSTVHECGHAWYAHNVDKKYDGTIFLSGISFGMHESQSRLCENFLARKKAFWEANYPILKDIFKDELKGIKLDDFIKAINTVRPSLIRTDADELTYPIHILIRYELEKGLFNGTISTEGLDKTWNKMYKEYLGIDVPSDFYGILQDDHWAQGAIGYFPTYALGTAFSAQFMHKMEEDIDIDNLLRNSKYDEIMGWLGENIHRYGKRYDAFTVIKKSTGEEFNPYYYIDYLKNKFGKLYKIE